MDDEPVTHNSKRPEGTRTQNSRLYRTGDRARYLPDGVIEFLGRVDYQVKVRGFRIELGEIEAALRQHPAVQDAVVMVWEDVPDDKRVVAYVVPKIEDRGLKIEDSRSDAADPLSSILYPLSSELRSFLQERLPVYMLPAAFVRLEALPLTVNGKLNRSALPDVQHLRPDLDTAYAPPEDEIEQTIAIIWRDVLQLDHVGQNDNFLELGGHSLLMVQVHSRLQEVVDSAITMIDLFTYPTVRDLARYIRQGQGESASVQQRQVRSDARRKSMQIQQQLRSRHRATRK